MASIDDWEWLEAADGLTEDNRFETALGILQRFIATRYHSSLLALAHLRAGLIQLRGLHRYPAAYQHLLAVLDLEPPVDVAQTARAALEEGRKAPTRNNLVIARETSRGVCTRLAGLLTCSVWVGVV